MSRTLLPALPLSAAGAADRADDRRAPAVAPSWIREAAASYDAACSFPISAESAALTWGDLIEAGADPAVVCLEDVQALIAALEVAPEPLPPALAEQLEGYVEQYFAAESENRRALSTVLTSLAADEGRGFILNGLYGAGKSHFLAAIALLASSPCAWEPFLRTHPEYERLAAHFQHREQDAGAAILPILVPLDRCRGPVEDLEDILFAEAEAVLNRFPEGQGSRLSRVSFALSLVEEQLLPRFRERLEGWLSQREAGAWETTAQREPHAAVLLAREFAEEAGIDLEWHEPRRERLRRLLDLARRCGRRGVLFCLDELSLFLASKTRDRFFNDVSFLQFLGQQSRYYPLWTAAAVQRGVEEVGDIDPDTLRKLKDRYTWDLTLSMAQIRPVLGRKVVRRKDPTRFSTAVEAIWRERLAAGLAGALDPEELADIYPLHPVTLECLTEASSRFFSKTRSVIWFTIRAVQAGGRRPAADLVGPDELFDQFWLAIEENPELRPTAEAFRYYARSIQEIVPEQPAYALRLVKALAAFAAAGLRKTVREVAECLPPPTELSSAPASSAAVPMALLQCILERLRSTGGYVEVSRGSEPGADVYYFDPGADLARTVRRRLAICLADISAQDTRLFRFAFEAASDASLPLASLDRPARVDVEWLTSRRSASVERKDLRTWSEDAAAAEVAWLADERQPETVRLLVGELSGGLEQRDQFLAVLRRLPADRWRAAVTAWIPRSLREDEVRVLREYAAFRLLLEDPTLRTNGLGRQILQRLRGERAARDLEARGVVRAAYAEGELVGGGRILASGRDLAAQAGRLESVAALAAGRVLPEIFPEFMAVAPRRKLNGRASLDPLLLELVLPGSAPAAPGSPLQGLVRDAALPLGVVTVAEGRMAICDPPAVLEDLVLSLVPEGETVRWGRVVGALGKSLYGLIPEQADLLLTVLVRRGHLEPCDGEGAGMALTRRIVPLSQSCRGLRRGDTLAACYQARLEALAEAVGVPYAGGRASDLEALHQRLCDLRAARDTVALQDGLRALLPALECSEAAWSGALAALGRWHALLEPLEEGQSAAAGLRQLLEAAPESSERELGALHRTWGAVRSFVTETGPRLAQILQYVSRPGCVLPEESDLESRRDRLRRTVGEGEALLPRAADAARYGEALLERYRDHYVAWHGSAFGEGRFAAYRRAADWPGWRTLGALDRLLPGLSLLPPLIAVVEQQRSRQCSSAGLLAALRHSPVCPACQLPAGTPVALISPEEIQDRLQGAVACGLKALAEPDRWRRLCSHREHRLPAGHPATTAFDRFLELLIPFRDDAGSVVQNEAAGDEVGGVEESSEGAVDGQGDAPGGMAASAAAPLTVLDSLLEEGLVREIRAALVAGEPAVRSVKELHGLLAGKEMPRTEAVRLFNHWLDPESRLGASDYIQFRE